MREGGKKKRKLEGEKREGKRGKNQRVGNELKRREKGK